MVRTPQIAGLYAERNYVGGQPAPTENDDRCPVCEVPWDELRDVACMVGKQCPRPTTKAPAKIEPTAPTQPGLATQMSLL